MGRLAILGLTGSILGWERSRVVLGSLLGVGTLWAGALPGLTVAGAGEKPYTHPLTFSLTLGRQLGFLCH